MIVLRTIADVRRELQHARVLQQRIGLVPTMGAFHDGHLHLMRTAGEECDVTVVSLFVNPTQFDDPNDLALYPRDEARDQELAESAGVDVLFVPSRAEMYPPGFESSIVLGGVTTPFEGAARGEAHFRGVATVVLKLFNIVQPHVAYFGQKDAQQTVVLQQLVRDLNVPLDIAVCPTVRESDGLAMSSRNIRLSAGARHVAVALSEALALIEERCANGAHETESLLQDARGHLVSRGFADNDIEYFAAVDSLTLKAVSVADGTSTRTPTLFAVAARVGGVRLIDNVLVPATSETHRIARRASKSDVPA